MGTDPAMQRAKNPGFLLVTTQNPISFEGREALSPAQLCRFISVTLKDYSRDELLLIAKHHAPRAGNEPLLALIDCHLAQQQAALDDPLLIAPNLRDFLRDVEPFKKKRKCTDKTEQEAPVKRAATVMGSIAPSIARAGPPMVSFSSNSSITHESSVS